MRASVCEICCEFYCLECRAESHSNFPLATVLLGRFRGRLLLPLPLRGPPLLRRLSGDGLERGARPLGGWSCIAVDLGLGLRAPLSRRRMLFRRLGFWLPSPSSASAAAMTASALAMVEGGGVPLRRRCQIGDFARRDSFMAGTLSSSTSLLRRRPGALLLL